MELHPPTVVRQLVSSSHLVETFLSVHDMGNHTGQALHHNTPPRASRLHPKHEVPITMALP